MNFYDMNQYKNPTPNGALETCESSYSKRIRLRMPLYYGISTFRINTEKRLDNICTPHCIKYI